MESIITNIVLVIIIAAIAIAIIIYLKKQSATSIGCIGCPYAGKCNNSCGKGKRKQKKTNKKQ